MNVISLGRDAHAEAQSLLPWYASGRLDEAEQHRVQAHLQACPRCRAELALEQRLQALPTLAGVAGSTPADVEAGLARLRPRLRAATTAAPRRARWWPWALGLQGGVIALLLALLVWPPDEPYRGLGDSAVPPSLANALVMFRPEASELQIRQALQAVDARLVGGPTAGQAYLLQIAGPAPRAAALQRLRAQPGVALAESLEAGVAR